MTIKLSLPLQASAKSGRRYFGQLPFGMWQAKPLRLADQARAWPGRMRRPFRDLGPVGKNGCGHSIEPPGQLTAAHLLCGRPIAERQPAARHLFPVAEHQTCGTPSDPGCGAATCGTPSAWPPDCGIDDMWTPSEWPPECGTQSCGTPSEDGCGEVTCGTPSDPGCGETTCGTPSAWPPEDEMEGGGSRCRALRSCSPLRNSPT